MEYFVDRESIVREIWGKGDTILLIFAGAAAEFALNKAVDWLYFTGRLPADPLGRLFSTVTYAHTIVFAEKGEALNSINAISTIHANVEKKRGASIPDWAYRDVLFMLIDYSIRSFEILERKLTTPEKQEVFHVFTRMGNQMGLKELPGSFESWKKMRQQHLECNLTNSFYTRDLYRQYKKHLGVIRYRILVEAQILVVPQRVRQYLNFRNFSLISLLIRIYKLSKTIKGDRLLRTLILPPDYKNEIKALDTQP